MAGCMKQKEPDWLDKVTFIKNYAIDSCSPTWSVYLQTGGRAVHNLVMSLLFIDMLDLVRSFLRPKGTRSRYHALPHLGRGKRRISKGLFPEPSDLIADTTRSITGLEKPKYSDGFNHLWELDGFLQKQINRVVFVNMATDFVYDWWSGILLNPTSMCDGARFSANYACGAVPTGAFVDGELSGFPQYEEGAICLNDEVVINSGTWQIIWTARATPLTGDPGDTMINQLRVGKHDPDSTCGKTLEMPVPAAGFVEEYGMSVVKAPCSIGVRGRVEDGSGEGYPKGGNVVNLRGFRVS